MRPNYFPIKCGCISPVVRAAPYRICPYVPFASGLLTGKSSFGPFHSKLQSSMRTAPIAFDAAKEYLVNPLPRAPDGLFHG